MGSKQIAVHRNEVFISVSEWIFNHPSLDSKERAVLWAISAFANREGKATPGLDTLAAQTGLSRRTVQRTLKPLSEKNILDVEYRFTNSNSFTLNASLLERLDRRSMEKYETTVSCESNVKAESPEGCPGIPDGVTESPIKAVKGCSLNRTTMKDKDLGGLPVTPLEAGDGFREFRKAPSKNLLVAPSMSSEVKELYQPLVDGFLKVLIDRELKKPEYFEEDRTSDSWHYALSKAFATASDSAWPPDDPKWLGVFEEAVDAMVSVGTRVVRPDRSEMQRAIETARIATLLDAGPKDDPELEDHDQLEIWAYQPEQIRERESRMVPNWMNRSLALRSSRSVASEEQKGEDARCESLS